MLFTRLDRIVFETFIENVDDCLIEAQVMLLHTICNCLRREHVPLPCGVLPHQGDGVLPGLELNVFDLHRLNAAHMTVLAVVPVAHATENPEVETAERSHATAVPAFMMLQITMGTWSKVNGNE